MTKLELVVLLRGNFVIVSALEEQKEILTKLLHECCKKAIEDPTLYLKWEDVTVSAKEIVGWYFRKPAGNPTEQMMKFLDKKMPNADEGNDWKNGG